MSTVGRHALRGSSASVPDAGRVPAERAGSHRLTSLDGLRGLAALVVVLHHAALTSPALAAQQLAPDHSGMAWWVTYTPLHLVWAGGESVLVFFVLSGLVLVLPQLRAPSRGTWPAYYLKRAVRLYVPVVAAVAMSGLVVTLVPRVGGEGWSWWMNAHVGPVQLSALVGDAALLGGTGWLNSALWSLRYEVFFSLFLPVFVIVVRRLTVPLWLSVPVALWGIGWAVSDGKELLSYMFVFAVGALLAPRLPTLRAWGGRISRSRFAPVIWTVTVGAGVLLLLSEWWMKEFVSDWTLWLPLGRPGAVLGAAILVFCFLHCPPVRAFGDSRALQWLGKISFSLYLVHEPLVVSVATFVPSSPRGLAVTVVVGLALSLAVAVLFFRSVERPSQRLAGRLGGFVAQRTRPAAPVQDTAATAQTVRLRLRPDIPAAIPPCRQELVRGRAVTLGRSPIREGVATR